MTALAVKRGRNFIAWEYLFYFGGGTPPVDERDGAGHRHPGARPRGEAAERAEVRRDRPARAGRVRDARRPPACARPAPRGGVHYLQYSFAPRLYIFNAFLQSLIGLYDFGTAWPTTSARGASSTQAEPEAREEVPYSDVGDWSLYNYAGHESNRDYHELLREFLQSMCTRRLGPLYCDYAPKLPRLPGRPARAHLQGPGSRDRGRAGRDPLQRLEALRHRGDGDAPGRASSSSTGSRPSAAGTAPSPGLRAGRRCSRCAWRRRSCAPGSGSATATAPRSRWRTGRADAPARGAGRAGAERCLMRRHGAAHHPLHREGRSRQDERRRRDSAPLRRGGTAHRGALHGSGPQPVRLARGPAWGRADPGRREPVRPGGAGPGGDGAPLGRRAGLARRPARRARHRPHLGRGADRPARDGRAVLAALDQAPPRGGRVRLRDRGLRADRRDAAAPVVPRRRDLVARAHPALAAQAGAVRPDALRHPAARARPCSRTSSASRATSWR